MINKEQQERRAIEVIETDNFGVNVNTDYTLQGAINDDQLLRTAKANGALHHVNAEVLGTLKRMEEKLNPQIKFFANLEKPEPKKKKLTKAELEAEEEEKENALLRARALKLMKKEKGLI